MILIDLCSNLQLVVIVLRQSLKFKNCTLVSCGAMRGVTLPILKTSEQVEWD